MARRVQKNSPRSLCSGPTAPALEQHRADYRRRARQYAGRKCKAVCIVEYRHGRRRHLRLGCKVHIRLLATRDRDCLRRTAAELDVIHRDTALPRLRFRPQYIQRRGCDRPSTVLWDGRFALHNRLRFSPRRVPQLSNVPRRSRGGSSQQDIRGHSLSIGKRRWLARRNQYR